MKFEDKSQLSLWVVGIVILPLTWFATALRVYVRGFVIKAFGKDDILQLLSMVTFTLEILPLLIVVCPRPTTYTIHILQVITAWILVSTNFYLVTSILLKLSLAFFYLRILKERWQRRTIVIAAVVYTVLGCAFIFILDFQCGKPSSFRSTTLTDHCGSWRILRPINYAYAALNTTTDWIFAVIPVWTVYKLQMRRRAKITSCILLGLGACASVSSMIRMGYIEGLNINKQLFPSVAIGITSTIEIGLAQTACCLATLKPLFGKWLENIVAATVDGGFLSFVDPNRRFFTPSSSKNDTGEKDTARSGSGGESRVMVEVDTSVV